MNRIATSLMTGLWGGATLMAMSFQPSGIDIDLALPASISAALAGAVTAPLFAKTDIIWTLLAAVLATSLGASLAGAFVGFPGDLGLGLLFGPITVLAAMAQSPLVALVWLAGAFAVRRTALTLRPRSGDSPTPPPIP